MIFTVKTVARSLADYLAPYLPGVTLYEDPNQQGTRCPAMFLQQRYAHTEKRLDGCYLRRIGLDLTYLEDYNLPDLQRRYLAAAEALDLVMDTFPYTDGGAEAGTLIRTYDREWTVDLDALHYKFELRARSKLQGPESPLMETMTEHFRQKEQV